MKISASDFLSRTLVWLVVPLTMAAAAIEDASGWIILALVTAIVRSTFDLRKLAVTIGFFYGNFLRGARRVVVDGIEPAQRPSESIQFEMFEYVYHQILRKDSDWVARDLLRERYRAHAAEVEAHLYDRDQVACVLLYTSPESMLEELISRKLDEGDVLANANTIIYLGKIREGNRLTKALYIPKHRGSACSDEIVPYTITDRGIELCG